jgi:hypothetical protein
MYDKHVQIRAEPPVFAVATRAPLRGGRIRWRLRPGPGAVAGQEGEIIATLTKPDGSQISSTVLFELLQPEENPAKKSTGHVPPFEIAPVSPDDGERWSALWPNDNDDAIKHAQHAYKVLVAGGKLTVYYSVVYGPYKDAVERLKVVNPVRLPLFDTNYQIWVGYHAILQTQQTETADVDEEVLDQVQDIERQTVAKVQVRQALRMAELLEQRVIYNEAKA